MSLIPFDPDYEDFARLYARLRHDGAPVPVDDVRVGDFLYLLDGPRLITKLGRSYRAGTRRVGVDDTGGPITITGGWTTIYDPDRNTDSVSAKIAQRGGRDHFMAITDSAEADLRRWQRRTGRKHPA